MEQLRGFLVQLIRSSRKATYSVAERNQSSQGALFEISRRAFLRLSATTVFANAPLLRLLPGRTAEFWPDQQGPIRSGAASPPADTKFLELLRCEDLVSLNFEFLNLDLRKGKSRSLLDLITLHERYPSTLRKVDPGQPSYIVVHFPPQHIAEKAFFEDASESTAKLPTSPVEARLSGESRLAFVLPKTIEQLDVTVDNLLNWLLLEPSLVPVALARGESTTELIRAPLAHETAIELPTRILLSPNHYSAWNHSFKPVSRRDDERKVTWTELWNTRLSVKLPGQNLLSDSNDYFRTVRAVFSMDSRGVSNPPPACSTGQDPRSTPGDDSGLDAMSERDRFEIVQLTSNFNDLRAGETHEMIDPQPIQVERLFLTSQGGWISSQGDWEPADLLIPASGSTPSRTEGLSVRQWRQESSAGRDTYVRVAYGGFLYPYGHRANLVQVTERRFQRKNPANPFKAYLRQHIFITVEQPVMEYGDAGVDSAGISIDRQMPFVSIECTTASTPKLDRPNNGDLKYPCYFWPRVLTKLFQFHFRGLDNAGQSTEFTSPVIFFEYGQRYDVSAITTVVNAFTSSGESRRPFGGQKLAFTPEQDAGDATMEADFVHFSAYSALETPIAATHDDGRSRQEIEVAFLRDPMNGNKSDLPKELAGMLQQAGPAPQPPLPTGSGVCCGDKPPKKLPRPPWNTHVPKAEVKPPALKGLAGPTLNTSIPIKWDPEYLKHGFTLDPGSFNLGHVFAGVDGLKVPFSLPDVHSVSLFKPDFDITGFSRKFGAVGGNLSQLKLGVFDPSSLFSGLSAKFLGALRLSNLFASNLDFTNLGAQIVPPFKTRVIKNSSGIPERIENYIDWEPKLSNAAEGAVQVTVGENTSAKMQVLVATQVKGGDSKQSLTAEIRNITVSIASAIDIEFLLLSFTSGDGQGTSVKVTPGLVKFRGGLAFVSSLQDKFGSSLWGGRGPRITFEQGAVVARASFALPNISFGIFSLQHLSLAPSLNLPILGSTPLSLGVDFASRQDPFLVGVGILAGGGYLLLRLGGDGVQSIEFSIEAGAHVALDLFVARGSAYVLIGVGMRYDRANPKDGLKLMLFLNAGGSFNIIGIITVSIQFTLTFSYSEGQNQVRASCTVTVSIDILFFHTDVHVTMQRTLNLGGGSDTPLALLERPLLMGAATHDPLESPDVMGFAFDSKSTGPKPASFEDLITEQAWKEYCAAFERFD